MAAAAAAAAELVSPAEPRPFRFRLGAHVPPAGDATSLVTAAAALATVLALKGLEPAFWPSGAPAEPPPHPARIPAGHLLGIHLPAT